MTRCSGHGKEEHLPQPEDEGHYRAHPARQQPLRAKMRCTLRDFRITATRHLTPGDTLRKIEAASGCQA
jgi:hypothetical protein